MTREHGRHLGLVRGGALAPTSAGAAAGQYARPHLARAARRASWRLRRRAARPARGDACCRARWRSRGSTILARCCGCCPSAIRTRAFSTRCTVIVDRLDDSSLAPRADGAVRGADARRMRLRARSLQCAATRRARRSDLRLAENRAARSAPSAGAPWRDQLLPLPAFLRRRRRRLRPAPPTSKPRSGLTGFFLLRDLFAPRGLKMPDSRRAFLAAAGRGEKG